MTERTKRLCRPGASLAGRWGLVFVMVFAAAPTLAVGQASPATIPVESDLGILSLNAIFGGLTAGITSAVRGGPFFGPFAHGVLGGSASYAGKRITASRFWGAGLLGRQVSATGASMVRSAAFGNGLLDTLFLPLGPGRLHVPTRRGAPVGYRLDLEETAWVVNSLTRDHLRFDLGLSLSSGAFVFLGDGRLRGEHDNALGRAAPGVISMRSSPADLESTLAHEQTHVAQFDYLKIVWGLPLEGALRHAVGISPDSWWAAHVESGLGHYPILWLLTAPWSEHGSRPLEREAEHMERIRGGG